MVTEALVGGGAERQLALLAASLPAEWSASVVTLSDGVFREVLEAAHVQTTVAARTSRWDVRPAAAVWRAVRNGSPTVVHTWGWMSTAAALPACRAFGVPLVDGGIRLGHVPPRRGRVQRFFARRADLVVANSRAGLRAFGFEGDSRGRVVYNGFDATRLVGLQPVRHDEGVVSVVMAARMWPGKDFALLIRAAEILGHEEPNRWRFVLVGAGPLREGLLRQAQRVRDCVVDFPEVGIEALPVVASADVGVLVTERGLHAEGCSNTIMEYMALGLPVVCSDSGGNREIVDDEGTALVVPPGDVDALVRALRRLGADIALRSSLGAAGLALADSRFSLDAFVDGFVRIYREASETG